MSKYNKEMFLEYASAFDYTEDFYNNAKENHGKPITWEQAIKENDEFMKSMNCWSLKDFQEWFDFRKFEIDENEQAKKGGQMILFGKTKADWIKFLYNYSDYIVMFVLGLILGLLI